MYRRKKLIKNCYAMNNTTVKLFVHFVIYVIHRVDTGIYAPKHTDCYFLSIKINRLEYIDSNNN